MQKFMKDIYKEVIESFYNKAKRSDVPLQNIVDKAFFWLAASAVGVWLLTIGTPLTLATGVLTTCAGIFGLVVAGAGAVGYAAGRRQQPATISEGAPKKDCTSCPTQLTCGKKNEFNDEACAPTGTTPAAQPKLITIDKKM